MNEAAPQLAAHRYHVIVNPNRILGMKEVEVPRSYETREAAEIECKRLNWWQAATLPGDRNERIMYCSLLCFLLRPGELSN